ncbi:MAG: SpvB/TcaC N-terminal domain-containing protein, partial [Leptospiraceae bacterium]|nr:SpvB/TcaC N-terminal domain-containing protein [Leptospiraceae bacterium]
MKGKESLRYFGLFVLFCFSARFGIGVVSNSKLPQPLPNVQANNGGLQASVDILLPEGTGLATPNLDLIYNSNGGAGILGLGWDLSGLHNVSRNPAFPIQYDDATDKFVSTISGNLVSTGTTLGNYSTENETYSIYQYNGSAWYAKDSSGTTYSFGTKTDSVSKALDRGNVVRKWLLDSVTDLNGNSYTIEYDGGEDNSPKKIVYGSGKRSVDFMYDTYSSARKGYQYSTALTENKILTEIQIKANDSLVRKYSFTYDKTAADGIPRLKQIDRVDSFQDTGSFYSTTFGYTPEKAVSIQTTQKTLELNETFVISRVPYNQKQTCLQGESDCHIAATKTCTEPNTYLACKADHNNKINACNEYTRLWKAPCWLGVTQPNNTMTVGDVNGDGKSEILRLLGTEDGKDIRIAKIALDATGNLNDDKNNSPHLSNVNYKTFATMGWGDVDGDGKTDFLYSNGTNLNVMFSNGIRFDGSVNMGNVSVPIPSFNYFQDMPDRKWKSGVVDINADGKSDYVVLENDTTMGVYLSNGRSFRNRIELKLSVPFIKGTGEEEQTGMFMDLDGDRIPEIVFWETDGLSYMKLNSSFTGIQSTDKIFIDSSMNTGDRLNRWIVDWNSDGKPDLVILRNLGNGSFNFDIYYYKGFRPKNVSFEKVFFPAPSGIKYITKEDLQQNSPLPSKTFADVNGDKFPDLIFSDGTNVRVFYNTQTGLADSGISLGNKALWLAMDVNGDGRAEIFTHKADNDELLRSTPITGVAIRIQEHNESFKANRDMQLAASNGGKVGAVIGGVVFGPIGAAAGAYVGAELGKAAQTVININSNKNKISTSALWEWLSFISQLNFSQRSVVGYFPSEFVPKAGQLNFVTDNNPVTDGQRTISVNYKYIKEYPETFLVGSGSSLPMPSNDMLVSSIEYTHPDGTKDIDTYTYSDYRYLAGDKDNFAILGFKKIKVNHSPENTYEEVYFNHSSKALAGTIEKSISYNAQGDIQAKSTPSYTVIHPFGKNLTVSTGEVSEQYRMGSPLQTVVKTQSYDSYGNIASSTTTSGSSTVTTSATYSNSLAYDTFHLGRVLSSTKTVDGVIVEQTDMSYDTNGNPSSVTQFPGTAFANSTYFQYDSYGNRTHVTDQKGRTMVNEYDTEIHKYLVKTINPLGHFGTKNYNTITGQELSTIDSNGAESIKNYDSFGRLISVKLPDSSEVGERYVYQTVPETKGTKVIKFVNDSTNQVIVSTTEFFDAKGRSVRKESPINGTNVLVEETVYDSLGRTLKKSNPYISPQETNVYWTSYEYDIENQVTKINHPDGSYTTINRSGKTETSTTTSGSGTVINTTTIVTNDSGQVSSRTIDGKTISYGYEAGNRLNKITDPTGAVTTMAYDVAGRKVSQTDANSGTTTYTYDASGTLKSQTDARGITQSFTYDELDRVKTTSTTVEGDVPIEFTYDRGTISESYNVGRLTQVKDETGVTNFAYDRKGNMIRQQKTIDEFTILFQKKYDSLNRMTELTYPDGTKIHQYYTPSGHASTLTMDSADGRSSGNTVVSYEGPIVEGTKYYINRKTGNNVVTKIGYDPVKKRPQSIETKLAQGSLEQHLSYSYDEKGNITDIQDVIAPARTQSFEYDNDNRLTKAIGKYGTEDYVYSPNGNLLKRGIITMKYDNANHIHAVTEASSPNLGTFHYSYDSMGNMISRNGDVMRYDGRGKLKEITSIANDRMNLIYNFGGERSKKEVRASNGQIASTIYYFGGLYEIVKEPGQPNKHTLYFKGLQGDIVSQMTRTDANLVGARGQGSGTREELSLREEQRGKSQEGFSPPAPVRGVVASQPGWTLNPIFGDCTLIAISCEEYRTNLFLAPIIKATIIFTHPSNRGIRDLLSWITILVSFTGLVFLLNRNANPSSLSKGIGERGL